MMQNMLYYIKVVETLTFRERGGYMGLFESIETVSIVLFAVGMIFLMIELFAPGFGIFGGLGLVALVLCIVVITSYSIHYTKLYDQSYCFFLHTSLPSYFLTEHPL